MSEPTTDGAMPESLVVFADALGTKDHSSDPNRCQTFLTCLKEASAASDRRLHAAERQIRGFGYRWFSDCLTMSAPSPSLHTLLSSMRLAAQIQVEFLLRGVFLRGAMTSGPHHHSENIDYGPALTEAAVIEQNMTRHPRILLSTGLVERIRPAASDDLIELVSVDVEDDSVFLNVFKFLAATERATAREKITSAIDITQGDVQMKYLWLAGCFNQTSGAKTFIPHDGGHHFREFRP